MLLSALCSLLFVRVGRSRECPKTPKTLQNSEDCQKTVRRLARAVNCQKTVRRTCKNSQRLLTRLLANARNAHKLVQNGCLWLTFTRLLANARSARKSSLKANLSTNLWSRGHLNGSWQRRATHTRTMPRSPELSRLQRILLSRCVWDDHHAVVRA